MTDDDHLARRPVDDVDSRAAELSALLAARRGQAAPAEPVEPEPPAPPQVEPEPAGPPAPAPQHFDPPDDGRPSEPTDTPAEPDPVATPDWPQPPAAAEPPPPDGPRRTGRRMPAPPWQAADDPPVEVFPAPGDRGLDAASDADEPSGRGRPVPPRAQPEDPRPAFRPPPPPGWNPPPPPPPPPGWPGPPLWTPPRRDRVPPPAGDERQAPARPSPGQRRPPGPDAAGTGPRDTTSPPAARPFDGASPDHEQLVPQFGWRRMLYRATRGRVNPGVSEKDHEQQDLLEQIRQPIASDFRIAVLSIKGGVGKTTTTLGLGSAFAMVRSDRVIAVDANPDRGTLAERISDSSTSSTVRDLLLDPDLSRYADVRRHTRMAPSRLEVLASVQDPAVAEVFGESDYRRTIEILQAHYNIILTDCGTGIMHSSMASVLDLAHALVLVSSPAVDAARSAAATLDWLSQHGYGMLARESHVVLSGARAGSRSPVFDEVFEYFEARSGSIHVVPFEPHLARGADVDFAMLSADAVRAYLELAGAVATKFPRVS